jgi:hypothetical protein
MLGDGSSGSIPTWETIAGGIGGSGTTNYVAKFTASTTVGNSLIFDNGTNVGIGTPTPQGKLDVQGILLAGNGSATDGTIVLQDQYSPGHLLNIGTNRSSGGVVLGYGVYPSSSTSNAFISSTSIGIERTAMSFDGSFRWYSGATQTASIGSSATLTQKMVMDNGGNLAIGIGTFGGKLTVNASTTGTSLYLTDSTNSTLYITHPSLGRTSFYNGSSTRWLTESGGEIGIEGSLFVGGISPNAKFQVNGGALATGGSGFMVSSGLTNGRLDTYQAGTANCIHTYLDAATYEISCGSTAGWISGISITGRNASLNPGTIRMFTYSNQVMQLDGAGKLNLTAYTSASSVPGTAVGYLGFDSSGNIITSNPAGVARYLRVTLSAELANTWANMPATLQFFDSSNAFITQAELSTFNQVRLIVNKGATAGATGSKLLLRYQATSGAPFTESSYLAIGTSEVSVAIDTTNTILTTSWINLASGAIGDVWVALMGIDGDSTADPVFGNITAEFRFNP